MKATIASSGNQSRPTRGRARRPGLLFLAAGALLSCLLWVFVRTTVAERLTLAARRDLETIVDLVVLTLEGSRGDAPELAGAPLLSRAAAANPAFGETLQRADDEHHRRIYFFDAGGRVFAAGGEPGGSAAVPAVVRQALAGLAPAMPAQGALFEPYADHEGTPVVGIWRWLPRHGIGIVAERPHARFVLPLRWIDGLFAGLVLLAAALPWLGRRGSGPGSLLARRDDNRCGPYELGRLIGTGAMAKVYLARHRDLGRWVALKRLRPHAMTEELTARFDREARLASRLSHPNIITVFDHGRTPDGGFYYAMEYVRGLTLTQWIEEHGPVPPARTVRILQQLCAAVGELHRHHLLHRDIKPDNILAYAAHGDYDLVKLLDFGLIKDMGSAASRDLTRDVRVLGTPAFMAPERLLDPAAVDRRSDIYGIGCIGFYLLTGRRPFEASRDADLAQQVLHVAAPAAAEISIFPLPSALDRLIAAALEKDPQRRPADADAFAAALDDIAAAVPWRRERARLWWLSRHPGAADTPAPGTSPG